MPVYYAKLQFNTWSYGGATRVHTWPYGKHQVWWEVNSTGSVSEPGIRTLTSRKLLSVSTTLDISNYSCKKGKSMKVNKHLFLLFSLWRDHHCQLKSMHSFGCFKRKKCKILIVTYYYYYYYYFFLISHMQDKYKGKNN